ncbi:YabP/YqfC family sporulation protein [uncultured Ruminococcus sp.]|uniref:YabP/YqfC family sporulation protein n=1 Tax=uncultured Ruminococcus sp. TaxID=165186 RepID=UPI0025D044E5|nr:YabP/YqfC family sporulation protein [uncultured Ruminococcus sp.]
MNTSEKVKKPKKFPLLSFFGLTKELLYLQSYIRISDNSSALVENCKQICDCTDVCVRVLTGSFEVEIWGAGLSLSNYSEQCVRINGTIEQVKLTSRRVREREQ